MMSSQRSERKAQRHKPLLVLLALALTALLALAMSLSVHLQREHIMCQMHASMTRSQHQQLYASQGQQANWPQFARLNYTAWQFKGVQKPPAAEGDRDLIPICNSTFLQQHPLSDTDYQRSYRPGGLCSMPPNLLDKLSSGQPVLIKVVGGSMTQGRRCFDGKRAWRECAWSSRLQDRLRETFPDANVTVHNVAIPGYSYGHWLQSGMIDGLVSQTDILVVDEQVNSHQYRFDAYKQQEAADEFLHGVFGAAHAQQRHVGVLWVEMFRTCGYVNASKECEQGCGPPSHGRQGQLDVAIKGHNSTVKWCNRWWQYADIERPVASYYQLPMASYRDAVWPVLNAPPSMLPCLWNGKSHPDSITHSIIGDVIAYGLIRAVTDSSLQSHGQCSNKLPPARFHPQLESIMYCSVDSTAGRQGTHMSVFNRSSFEPVYTDNWFWHEDVPGKPGWIYDASLVEKQKSSGVGDGATHGNVTAAIWFKVQFSQTPQLQVTYLTTYNNIGVVELTIHNIAASPSTHFQNKTAVAAYQLNAKIPDALSIPKTSLFVSPSGTNARTRLVGTALPSGLREGTYLVALRPILTGTSNDKFKLLGLTSC